MKTFISTLALLFITSATTFAQTRAINSTTEYAKLSDRKIAYRSIGSGTPIILVNRFRGTLDTWDPLFLDNLAKTHRVITFDYTGIGYSSGQLPTDITVVAKDVSDLAAYLKLKKTILLGWSYGGLVAQTAAMQSPELITDLILLGTGPLGKREVPLEQAFLDAALKPVNDFDDEIVLFFEPKSSESRLAAKASHDRIAQRLDVSKIPSTMETFQLYFKGGAAAQEDKENLRAKLCSTTIPILVVCGDHDISFDVANWYPLIRKLPTAQIIVLPQTGHAPQHQNPNLVAAYIESFLSNQP
jgi:pimeloyl-ACP methyl ester carboxylesterase